eukprot:TRINITY_DN32084_c0_g1_i1.p1 TRINITY_DN32084_c0_g1~~TRINITY_DN32084_c0_g1_i1.p1  ORF type:complete len:124 (+),score=4.21 TRINITY_DN32084_c0_g1_i1:230-601(+)
MRVLVTPRTFDRTAMMILTDLRFGCARSQSSFQVLDVICRQNLSWVHKTERVQRGLDGLLNSYVRQTVLAAAVHDLAETNAMLARHSATHLQSALHHSPFPLLRQQAAKVALFWGLCVLCYWW